MADKKIQYEMYIHWQLVKRCNFACEYCLSRSSKGMTKPVDIPRIIDRLGRFNKTILITLTGGEPFLVPNFTELVYELTKKHYVRIDTNLSLKNPCEKFMHTIDPKQVLEITFSIHALERERRGMDLADLCSLVKRFQDKGFKMVGNYVAYPPILGKMEKDIEFFKTHGIEILPSFFVGRYEDKEYPFKEYPLDKGSLAYCEREAALIMKMNPYAKNAICNSKNDPCHAGLSAFYVNAEYEVFLCLMIFKKIGDFFGEWNILPKVIKCPIDFCCCPFNKSMPSSPNTFAQADLLNKTISEKGVASSLESYILTINACLLFKVIVAPVMKRLGLAKFYHRFRRQIALTS